MSDQLATKPNLPFLYMNQYYMCIFESRKGWQNAIRGFAFDSGRFKQDAVIIDADCRKFGVVGAVKKGWSFGYGGLLALNNLFYPPAKRSYKFEFLVSEPEQLTFEQARDEIVEHVCNHRWASKVGGSPANFRKHHATQTNIVDVMRSIGAAGKIVF